MVVWEVFAITILGYAMLWLSIRGMLRDHDLAPLAVFPFGLGLILAGMGSGLIATQAMQWAHTLGRAMQWLQ